MRLILVRNESLRFSMCFTSVHRALIASDGAVLGRFRAAARNLASFHLRIHSKASLADWTGSRLRMYRNRLATSSWPPGWT